MTTPAQTWTVALHRLTGDTVLEIIDYPAPDLVLVELANGARRELARSVVTVYVSRFPSPYRGADGVTTRDLTKDSAIADLPVTGDSLERVVGQLEFEAAWNRVVRLAGGCGCAKPALFAELHGRLAVSDASDARGMAGVARQLAADIESGLWKP